MWHLCKANTLIYMFNYLQVKRIHEYKRQMLNVLGIIWRYDQLKRMTPEQREHVWPLSCNPHSSNCPQAISP